MKKIKLFLLVAVMLCMSVVPAFIALANNDDHIVIYAEVPDDWENPRAWAWGPRGDAFDAWPGGLMIADVNNPGWYYIHIPADKTGALINGNDGEVQTSDFDLDGNSVWVTVTSADEFMFTTDKQTDGDLPPFVGMEVSLVYAAVPDDWDSPGIWAWGPRGDAFDSWPGGKMTADPNNNGWFFAHIPSDATGALINANEGSTQTGDFEFTGANVWVTVADDGEFEITTIKQTDGDLPVFDGKFYEAPPFEAPDVSDAGTITVRSIVPANWAGPGVWAWNEGEGIGDVFGGWPGEQFAETDGEWHIMTLPDWIDHIIINGNSGSVQTNDIPVEPGKDIWIVVFGDERNEYTVSHEPIDPDGDFAVELPELAPPVTITADPTPKPPSDPGRGSDSSKKSTMPVVLIVVIIVAVVAVIVFAVIIIIKKSKQVPPPSEPPPASEEPPPPPPPTDEPPPSSEE